MVERAGFEPAKSGIMRPSRETHLPLSFWFALRESNSRHLVKSQVHSHYAKSDKFGLPGGT